MRPHGEDHFVVRSPALLGLVADWVRAGVPLGEALDLIEVLTGDLDALAGKLAELIVARIWEPLSAAGRRRGAARPAPAGHGPCCSRARPARSPTGSARRWPSGPVPPRDGGQLLAVLDEIRVGAVADAAGTIHRRGGDR